MAYVLLTRGQRGLHKGPTWALTHISHTPPTRGQCGILWAVVAHIAHALAAKDQRGFCRGYRCPRYAHKGPTSVFYGLLQPTLPTCFLQGSNLGSVAAAPAHIAHAMPTRGQPRFCSGCPSPHCLRCAYRANVTFVGGALAHISRAEPTGDKRKSHRCSPSPQCPCAVSVGPTSCATWVVQEPVP